MDCSMPGFPVLHCLPESARSRPLTWWYYPIISFSAVPSPPALSLSRMYMFNFREREVAQSCPTLCDPMGCSLSGSSVHGIFQARVLEWIAISFSRGHSRPRNRTQVSRIAGRCFTVWATREVWGNWRESAPELLFRKYLPSFMSSEEIHCWACSGCRVSVAECPLRHVLWIPGQVRNSSSRWLWGVTFLMCSNLK